MAKKSLAFATLIIFVPPLIFYALDYFSIGNGFLNKNFWLIIPFTSCLVIWSFGGFFWFILVFFTWYIILIGFYYFLTALYRKILRILNMSSNDKF